MPRIPPELAASLNSEEDDSFKRLEQTSRISAIDDLGNGEWTVLYEYDSYADGSLCSYSALLQCAQVPTALKDDSWDLRIGSGSPGFSQYRRDGVDVVEYNRFGFDGVEPIVHVRDFHGIKPRQFDLNEEFRLFHNLYHDRYNDRYLHIDDRGEETIVVEIANNRSRVLTHYLRQYMAARQLALAIFFDHRVDARIDLKSTRENFPSKKIVMPDRNYSFHVGEGMDGLFSRLLGKKIVMPPPISMSGVWPYETKRHRRYEEFIIGVDNLGQPVSHCCDPDLLANYFGANAEAPHYLTPVWFKRDVLVKYYNDPNKFSVEDGYLRCGSLWGLRLDNNLDEHVMVYLGDLGRDLDQEEQRYWRHFNVTPGGRSPSQTNFRRAFLAQFANASAADLAFKESYIHLNEVWTKKFGWPIFRPLHEEDAHIIKQLHIPGNHAL